MTGLLHYKAHSHQYQQKKSYACATPGEMREFIDNLSVELKIERVRVRNGVKVANLVMYFDPFPVKYLNYIKTYNAKEHSGTPCNYPRHNGNEYVYVQLFRLVCGGMTVTETNPFLIKNAVSRLRGKDFWGEDYGVENTNTWLRKTKPIREIHGYYSGYYSFGMDITGRERARSESYWYVRHRHILSPQDAKRGYCIMMHDFCFAKTYVDDRYCHSGIRLVPFDNLKNYSNSACSDYPDVCKGTNFQKGVVGGVVYLHHSGNGWFDAINYSNSLKFLDFKELTDT